MELVKSTMRETLLDAGCEKEAADSLAALLEAGLQEEAYQALLSHRKALLTAVHAGQKKLACLDYLLYCLRNGQEVAHPW